MRSKGQLGFSMAANIPELICPVAKFGDLNEGKNRRQRSSGAFECGGLRANSRICGHVCGIRGN